MSFAMAARRRGAPVSDCNPAPMVLRRAPIITIQGFGHASSAMSIYKHGQSLDTSGGSGVGCWKSPLKVLTYPAVKTFAELVAKNLSFSGSS